MTTQDIYMLINFVVIIAVYIIARKAKQKLVEQTKTIDNLYADIQLLELREMFLKDELKDLKLELEVV